MGVGVFHPGDGGSDTDSNVQLLPHDPFQSVFGRFSGIEDPPGKFPERAEKAAARPLNNQDPLFFIEV